MTRFSDFGEHFRAETGTRLLMDDLGEIQTSQRAMINLGGGNPGHIPAVHRRFLERMQQLLDNGSFDALIGRYAGPQGDPLFIQTLATLLKERFGWPVDESNIAITAGSQTSFFMLFNMLAGPTRRGEIRHILLPITPEYIGYADVGLHAQMLRAAKPRIEILDEQRFKYHVDFDALSISTNTAAVCVSRPTNPTGNVITNAELDGLIELTRTHDIPLIIDNAYGLPFPNIVFTDAEPVFQPHVILCMSLSKLGLPGARTGIVVADPEIIQTLSSMNAVVMLANSSLGTHLVQDLFESGEITTICRDEIRPFYARKAELAVAWCRQYFAGLQYYIHVSEGAIFLWVWFPDLPISDIELYRRLKTRGVVVLTGRFFFPGLAEPWSHREQCLRISFAQEESAVRRGIEIIGEEVRSSFSSRA